MHLDKQQATPIYIQLKELLQNQIEQGVYASHQKLPSERDLCQHYNLSRMTARRALKELIAAGLAYTRVGKGTFVSHNPIIIAKIAVNVITNQYGGLEPTNHSTVKHCRQQLVDHLLSFNCADMEQIIKEVLVNHPLEIVAFKLFPEIIYQLEQQWHNDEISLIAQNYAMMTLRSQLISMVNAVTTYKSGPKVLLACAPEDQHEIGLLLLALSLRRQGFSVIYLGPNVATTDFNRDFNRELEIIQPQLVCFSAATAQSAKNLALLSQAYQSTYLKAGCNGQPHQKIPFTFGGVAFNQNQALISTIPGLYLGDNIETAVQKIQELLFL